MGGGKSHGTVEKGKRGEGVKNPARRLSVIMISERIDKVQKSTGHEKGPMGLRLMKRCLVVKGKEADAIHHYIAIHCIVVFVFSPLINTMVALGQDKSHGATVDCFV